MLGRYAHSMDRTITRLPAGSVGDPLERALLEIDIAIALVLAGVAVTVTLCFLDATEAAAFTGAVWSQTAGVAFHLLRNPSASDSLVIGPRLRPVPVETGFEPES
jgi:hypothetical protein